MRKQGTRLPQEELDLIKEMLQRGGNYSEIARGLQRNKTTIRLAALEMGLDSGITRRPLAADHREQILSLAASGLTDEQIVKIVGYSVSTISKARREGGLEKGVKAKKEMHDLCPGLTGTMRKMICGSWTRGVV
jgi:DNA invertase Pin-like site-specific DNA recombinase